MPIVVPQWAEQLGHRQSVGVVPDQTQNKDAIRLQIVVDESPQLTTAGVGLRVVTQVPHQAEVVAHVVVTVDAEGDAHRPRAQRQRRQRGHRRHPEPDEEEDLLVEEVDRKNALHSVALHVGQPADTEVAQGHAREPDRE